jgi:hypothetical protein
MQQQKQQPMIRRSATGTVKCACTCWCTNITRCSSITVSLQNTRRPQSWRRPRPGTRLPRGALPAPEPGTASWRRRRTAGLHCRRGIQMPQDHQVSWPLWWAAFRGDPRLAVSPAGAATRWMMISRPPPTICTAAEGATAPRPARSSRAARPPPPPPVQPPRSRRLPAMAVRAATAGWAVDPAANTLMQSLLQMRGARFRWHQVGWRVFVALACCSLKPRKRHHPLQCSRACTAAQPPLPSARVTKPTDRAQPRGGDLPHSAAPPLLGRPARRRGRGGSGPSEPQLLHAVVRQPDPHARWLLARRHGSSGRGRRRRRRRAGGWGRLRQRGRPAQRHHHQSHDGE